MLKKIIFTLIVVNFCFSVVFAVSKDIPYGTGSWDEENLGNHRAIIYVDEKAEAVKVHIPWRRRDMFPERKNIVVIDASTDAKIENIICLEVNREYGDLVFQPHTVPGDYYVYYLINKMQGRSNYPTVIYPKVEQTAEAGWLKRNSLASDLPNVEVKEFQAIDKFNSFYPMEVIAAQDEVKELLAQHKDSAYLLFPEDRKFPIRMTDDLPFRWIKKGPQKSFKGEAARGEYYAFQIGLFACRQAVSDLDVNFHSLKDIAKGETIKAVAFSSFNTEGIDWKGRRFKKLCPVPKGKIQPLWCGVQVPLDISPGQYEGLVTVVPEGLSAKKIKIILKVSDKLLMDKGDSEPWRHSRLRWLNSLTAFDDGLVSPYTPVKVEGSSISCLGRKVGLDRLGFPESIISYFTPEMTSIGKKGREMLSSPVKLIVEGKSGRTILFNSSGVKIKKKAEGAAVWESHQTAGKIKIDLRARLEFDGYLDFIVKVTASESTEVKDIRLEIPLNKEVAKYMMGLGVKGGFRPDELLWKWEQKHNQDSAWLGDVNAGLQCSFRDENYSRPLNTNFYLLKPLVLPKSWWNQGKGGCDINEKQKNTVLISTYSGNRVIQPGEELFYNFSLLITPFRPLDTTAHWNTRYYHSFEPVEEIAVTGANTINVHHANEINPYINYPFLRPEKMKTYIDKAHARDMKVKIYYTVRELSNRAPELFALRSLGDEIFFPGEGGGFSWLQEHLGGNYIAAWFVPKLKDAAIINSGVSRWHNYYVEGLSWLGENVGIDGLYIDDVAFDRTTMKRVRKVLNRKGKKSFIDLHSANQFNVRDGYANSANLYLEHFPYIDRLWFGEYFDYNSMPDFWLIEVSGIPFGLMGEMLQDGGNPWRGMIYGMTSRLPWAGDPTPIWKVWDEFGIQDAEMVGYWAPSCPVKTSNIDVKATVYIKEKKIMVVLASWAPEEVLVELKIDWKSIGIDEEKAMIHALFISNFQVEADFKPGDAISVKPGKGWIFVIQ